MLLERRRTERERRGAHRVPAVFAVKNRVGVRIQLAQAQDLGPEGMTLRQPQDSPCAPSTTLYLHFDLPGRIDPIGVEGVVVNDYRTGPFRRTGVRFTTLPHATRAQIALYCASRRQAPPPEGSAFADDDLTTPRGRPPR